MDDDSVLRPSRILPRDPQTILPSRDDFVLQLPNGHRALIDPDKLLSYLLNPAHPDNGGKASFFESLGFRRSDWRALARALRQLATRSLAARAVPSQHGVKYILDGEITGPRGTRAFVRTVWILDRGHDTPRLVTAYPATGGQAR